MSFNNMGKPIPVSQKELGMKCLIDMGMTDKDKMVDCISTVCEQLERDKPFEAQQMAMKYIDLTGSYRLFAVLLSYGEEEPTP